MTAPDAGNVNGALPPHSDDLLVLASLARGSAWLRAVTCTLARRGVAFRRAYPERARALLDAVESAPLYKMGQFLFDLTEWEDFMVDGPPPPLVPSALDQRALVRIATLLRELQAHVDGAAGNGAAPAGVAAALARPAVRMANTTGEAVPGDAAWASGELPPLEAGFYLYQDVVVGAMQSAVPMLRAAAEGGGL